MPGPLERIEVVDGEHVVERGHAQIVWFVEKADGWVWVGEWPAAAIERLDPGPGTNWQSRIGVELPRGTLLMRVETRPGADPALGPLDYLLREVRKPARRVARRYFRVDRGGRLLPARAR